MGDGLLLDTCAAIWLVDGDPLSEHAARAIEVRKSGGVFISLVSAWEFGMLSARGRTRWLTKPLDVYRGLVSVLAAGEVPLSDEILVASSYLPGSPPPDPFDRIVIATARHHGLTVLTRDRRILAYAEAGHVAALAC